MKTIRLSMLCTFALLLFSGFLSTLSAQGNTLPSVKISNIPDDIDEFIKMRNSVATTPQGGAAMFILALKIYTQNAELGEKCLIVMTDKNALRESEKGYKGFSLLNTDMDLIKSQLGKQKFLPNSYSDGCTPENDYKVKLPYNYTFTKNKYSGSVEEGNIKIFVACSGANTPRPIRMKINDKGLWKASEWSSLLVGIKAPKSEGIDDL